MVDSRKVLDDGRVRKRIPPGGMYTKENLEEYAPSYPEAQSVPGQWALW
jgi:hypothetical protein